METNSRGVPDMNKSTAVHKKFPWVPKLLTEQTTGWLLKLQKIEAARKLKRKDFEKAFAENSQNKLSSCNDRYRIEVCQNKFTNKQGSRRFKGPVEG
jgi:hypothetical protein